MKNLKKIQVFMLALIIALGVAVPSVSAAAPKLNKTKVTLTVGKSTTLKLNSAPKGQKITWSTSNKKIAAVSQKGKVTAKKAGTAVITAKVAKKKYTCRVTVKNKPADSSSDDSGSDILFYHEGGKNKADVKALEAIIREQNGKYGAKMPVDLDNKRHYVWNNERLYRISYLALGDSVKECPPLKGNLDLTPFSELAVVQCMHNELTSLNVKGLKKLERIECDHGTLTSLDLSTNAALEEVICSDNKLTSLDLSTNTALVSISCNDNKLTSLDLSKNTALEKLYCTNNQLTKLDLSANKKLKVLDCGSNQLTELDLSSFSNLTDLDCKDCKPLTSIKLDGCMNLHYVYASGCALTSLDLSQTGVEYKQNVKVDESVQVTYPAGVK